MFKRRGISAHLLQMICMYSTFLITLFLLNSSITRAQEPPYFVTYSDSLEEPGNMEIAYKGVYAAPQHGGRLRCT
jgi:hypothetical protein